MNDNERMDTHAPTVIEPHAVYTREQVCQLLGVSLSTLFRYRRSGKLVGRQVARRVFFLGSDVLDFLEAGDRDPA